MRTGKSSKNRNKKRSKRLLQLKETDPLQFKTELATRIRSWKQYIAQLAERFQFEAASQFVETIDPQLGAKEQLREYANEVLFNCIEHLKSLIKADADDLKDNSSCVWDYIRNIIEDNPTWADDLRQLAATTLQRLMDYRPAKWSKEVDEGQEKK